MQYSFKSEENYQNIQEALSDFDSISGDNTVLSIELKNWLELYSELHLKCIKDRYFNSCFPDFPCAHTENNIEYVFSMFYYGLVEIKNCFELNLECEDYLKRLIQSTPNSQEEDLIISELRSLKNGAYSSFENLDRTSDPNFVLFKMPYFNYMLLKLMKRDLSNLHKIAEVYAEEEY